MFISFFKLEDIFNFVHEALNVKFEAVLAGHVKEIMVRVLSLLVTLHVC